MGTIRAVVATLIVGLTATTNLGVVAAEIKVFSIPFKGPLDQIGPEFERATGHRLAVKYAPATPLRERIDAGEHFDVILALPSVIDELAKRGKLAADTHVGIARAGLGLAVRKGAEKPDVQSIEAFKRTLLAAKSIAYAAQGPSGVYLVGLLERLGVAQDIKPKLKPVDAGSQVVGPVARGEAEIGIVSIPFIVAEPGVEMVGPLPRELQHYVEYSSAVGATAHNPNAAKALVDYLRQPSTAEILRAHGMEAVGAR